MSTKYKYTRITKNLNEYVTFKWIAQLVRKYFANSLEYILNINKPIINKATYALDVMCATFTNSR